MEKLKQASRKVQPTISHDGCALIASEGCLLLPVFVALVTRSQSLGEGEACFGISTINQRRVRGASGPWRLVKLPFRLTCFCVGLSLPRTLDSGVTTEEKLLSDENKINPDFYVDSIVDFFK